MKISIALASYNGAAFIEEQLRSFTSQTRLPDELVVCDDGSTDGTVELIEDFASACSFPVRIYRNPENLGYNRNFEKAVTLCSGDVVFISDQDDVWLPEKIEAVAGELHASPATMMVINDEFVADGAARPVGVTILENVRRLGYPDTNHVAGCCTAIRRELIPFLLPFSETLYYDSWIASMAEIIGVKKIYERPLQLYRRHGANTTKTVLAHQSPSTWLVIRTYGVADPRQAWEEQIAVFHSFRRRIEERKDMAIGLAGRERVQRALTDLDRQIDSLTRRLRLLSKPRLTRLPSVLRLWRNGFYASFGGGKSAIKDIIRA